MKCLCATTRRIARLLTQRYEEALHPVNLTPAQFELMSAIALHSGVTQARLAQSLTLDQTTLSRNLNLLAARAWIGRQTSTRDRRQTNYVLTPEGKQVWSQSLPLWQAVNDQLHRQIGAAWPTIWSTLDLLNQVAVP